MIILHNIHSAASRDFVDAYSDQATQIIDWYANGTDMNEYLGRYQPPSSFPAIVDEETGVMVNEATNPAELAPKIIEALVENKKADLRNMCKLQIESGVESDVLGSAHIYPSKQSGDAQDQLNMTVITTMAEVYGAQYEPYVCWCADGDDVWARRSHTAQQIITVGLTMKAHVSAQQDHYESKLLELASTTTIEEIKAVSW